MTGRTLLADTGRRACAVPVGLVLFVAALGSPVQAGDCTVSPSPFWKNVVAFLNLAATCLTLATLTTRFVFPMISLEGQRFWILGLMPVSRWKILRTKFLFVLAGSFVIALILVTLSNVMLETMPEILLLQCQQRCWCAWASRV